MQRLCSSCGKEFEGINFSKYCSSECGDFQVFQGQKYYRLGNGYYMGKSRHLHRVVWEHYHCQIPKNHDIHHKDGDRSNNNIQNLECLPKDKHKEIHKEEWREFFKTTEGKARTKKMLDGAKRWLNTTEGRNFRSEQMKLMRASQCLIDKTCEYCDKSFQTKENFAKFCSDYCYHTKRRKDGIDHIDKTCVVCGAVYQSRKFIKSNTCSDSCRGIFRSEKMPLIEKICRNCKKTFFSKSQKSLFCRRLCGSQYRRQKAKK